MNLEHKPTLLADQVFEKLETEILSGTYSRGEVLTELRLVNDLGVSRTPIREALRRLDQEHLVEIQPKGIVVIGISQKDLRDIFDIREYLEGKMTAETANRITDEELRQLRETLELQEFYMEKHDPDRIRAMDNQFHQLVCRFSGSTVFYDTLIPLHRKVQKFRRLSLSNHEHATLSVFEHWEIYRALEARDPVLAEQAALRHAQHAKARVLKHQEE